LGLEGSTKPISKEVAAKTLRDVLVGSARTEGGSDASVGVRSLDIPVSPSRKTRLAGNQRPKLRSSVSGPVGGLSRPLRTQEEVMKDARRRSICGKPNEGVKKREGRKSDIFASLDREEETVEMTAGPLMRQLPTRAKSESTDRMVRPHLLRQGPTRSENTGPVFGVGSGNTLKRGSAHGQGGLGHGSTHSQTSMRRSTHNQQSFGGKMGSMHGTGHSKSSMGSLGSFGGSDDSFGGNSNHNAADHGELSEDFTVALGASHSSFAKERIALQQRKEQGVHKSAEVQNSTKNFDNSFASFEL
jgi:hypothetical protein